MKNGSGNLYVLLKKNNILKLSTFRINLSHSS